MKTSETRGAAPTAPAHDQRENHTAAAPTSFVAAVRAIRESTASIGDRHLLLALLEWADLTTGECFPGLAKIEQALGLADDGRHRNVRKRLEKCVKAGWVEVVKYGGGRGRATVFRIVWARLNAGDAAHVSQPTTQSKHGSEVQANVGAGAGNMGAGARKDGPHNPPQPLEPREPKRTAATRQEDQSTKAGAQDETAKRDAITWLERHIAGILIRTIVDRDGRGIASGDFLLQVAKAPGYTGSRLWWLRERIVAGEAEFPFAFVEKAIVEAWDVPHDAAQRYERWRWQKFKAHCQRAGLTAPECAEAAPLQAGVLNDPKPAVEQVEERGVLVVEAETEASRGEASGAPSRREVAARTLAGTILRKFTWGGAMPIGEDLIRELSQHPGFTPERAWALCQNVKTGVVDDPAAYIARGIRNAAAVPGDLSRGYRDWLARAVPADVRRRLGIEVEDNSEQAEEREEAVAV